MRYSGKISKTARGALKIHSDEPKERIKHGYLATEPTVGPAGLCIKGRMPRERFGKTCDSERCMHHSCDLKLGLHGFLSFFSFLEE